MKTYILILDFVRNETAGKSSLAVSTDESALVSTLEDFNAMTEKIRVDNNYDQCVITNIIPLPI